MGYVNANVSSAMSGSISIGLCSMYTSIYYIAVFFK